MSQPVFTLLHPEEAPFIGLYSAANPFAVQKGRWIDAYNLRFNGNGLKVRGACTALGSSPAGTAALGAAGVYLNGTYYLVVAAVDGSNTGIFKIDQSTGAPTELTSNSGSTKHGVTRFTSTTREVQFAVVYDFAARKDLLVISNGNESIRVWDESAAELSIHQEISLPAGSSSLERVEFGWSGPLPIGNTSHTLVNSGANFALTYQGASPNKFLRLTITTSVAASDTAEIQCSAVDMSNARQLHMVYEVDGGVTWLSIWDDIKVEISENGADYYTVYDPFSAEGERIIEACDDIGRFYIVAFALDHIASANRNAVTRVRFTWVGAARGAGSSLLLDLYGIGASGNVPGGSVYSLSYYHSASRAESKSLIVQNCRYLRVDEADTGAGSQRQPDLSLPRSEALYYRPTVYFQNTSQATRDTGVDTLRIYRRDPGDIPGMQPVFVKTVSLATYGGGAWSFVSGTALSIRSDTDTVDSASRDIQIWAPDAFHRIIPAAAALYSLLGRLYCGNIVYDGKSERGTVWISEERNPFRFRLALRRIFGSIDPTSASLFTLQGEEVRGFASFGAHASAGATAFVGTDRSLYAVSDRGAAALASPQYIGPYGVMTWRTLQSWLGSVVWLGSDRHVIQIGTDGAPRSLSMYVVEDRFLDTTAPENSAAVVFKNQYLISYQQSGSSNKRILVYDFMLRQWISDDRIPGAATVNAKYLVRLPNVKGDRLFMIAANSQPYKYDSSDENGDLGGTLIDCGLKSGALHDAGWYRLEVSGVGVMCDTGAGATATTLRAALFGEQVGDNASGTIDIDDAVDIWKWDKTVNDIDPGVSGNGIQVSVDFKLPRASQITAIVCRARRVGEGASGQ